MQHFDIEIKVFKNLMNGPVNLKLVIIGNNQLLLVIIINLLNDNYQLLMSGAQQLVQNVDFLLLLFKL